MKFVLYGLLSVFPLSVCLGRQPTNATPPPQLLTTNLPPTVPSPAAARDNSKIERGFAVKKAGSLFLTFPKSWKDSIGLIEDAGKQMDAVNFVPRLGDEFAILVEIINAGEENIEHLDIKAILEKIGRGELANTVEKTLDIHEFQGPQMTGCYFVVTDKNRTIAAPKAGQYLHLTQGYAKIGTLVLSFRLVSNHFQPEQDQMLDMIKTARFVKK